MKRQIEGIIIGGAPRSGKSILGRALVKRLGWTLVHGDSLVGAFEETFPSLGITHGGSSHREIAEAFEPWVFRYLQKLAFYKFPYVCESYHFRPESLYREGFTERCRVLYIGYPEARIEDKLENVRIYSSEPDWMSEYSDSEATLYLERFRETSKRFQDECSRYNIPFVDLSNSFSERLRVVVDSICMEVGEDLLTA